MKKLMSAAVLAAFALAPAVAEATEREEPRGSWLVLLFFAINFSLFVFVVVYFASPYLRGFFADRTKTIREAISRAEHAFAEAHDRANKAADAASKLEANLAHTKSDLDDETTRLSARIRDGARATADRIREDARLTTTALVEGAERSLRERLADSAATIARELIDRSFRPADQQRLVTDFMERLAEESAR